MTPGIYKDGELLRQLTIKDLKSYEMFKTLLKDEKITETGLDVIVPKCDIYNPYFFDESNQIKLFDMSKCGHPFYLQYCECVEDVILPDKLSESSFKASKLSFGYKATRLKNLHIKDTNEDYYTKNGVLYSKKHELVLYPVKNESEIEPGTTTITNGAFFGIETDCLKIPYGVTTLDSCSLEFNNQKERTVILPSTINEVSGTFAGIFFDFPPLTIYCPDNVKKVLNLGEYELRYITLKDLTLDDLLRLDDTMSITDVNNYLKEAER